MRYALIFTLSFSIINCHLTNAQSPTEVTDDNFIYLSEAIAQEPAPIEEIARMTIPEYRSAKDEFKAKEILESVTADIKSRIVAAKSMDSIFVRIAQLGRGGPYFCSKITLPQYDFIKQGFPVSPILAGKRLYPYSNYYAVVIANAEAFDQIYISKEKAEMLSRKLAYTRDCILTLYGKRVGSENSANSINVNPQSAQGIRKDYSYRAIIMKATKLKIELTDGTLVGEAIPKPVDFIEPGAIKISGITGVLGTRNITFTINKKLNVDIDEEFEFPYKGQTHHLRIIKADKSKVTIENKEGDQITVPIDN